MDNEKIFVTDTFVSDKDLHIYKKFSLNEILDFFDPTVKICEDEDPYKQIRENAILYFPKIENNAIILSSRKLDDICKERTPQSFVKTISQQYNDSAFDKTDFKRQIESFKILDPMTQEDADEYIANLPNLDLSEWIDNFQYSLYISNYSIIKPTPDIKIQTRVFNDLLSHFFTFELIYAISEEIQKQPSERPSIFNFGNKEIEKFKDIKEILKNDTNLRYLFDVYHMLKCLCFILHDKPVNSLAPLLIDEFGKRILLEDENVRVLKNIYINGFNIQENKAMVTQGRCHKTIDNLTNKFKEILKSKGIFIPEINKVFSIPYSAFKVEKESKKGKKGKTDEMEIEDEDDTRSIYKEISKILTYYEYGLGDAVGNDTFILNAGKKSIYPDTLAMQDAAGVTKLGKDKQITVSEDNKQYQVNIGDNKKNIDIEPLRFLDIAIICKKIENKEIKKEEEKIENYFLYYASNIEYNENNYINCPIVSKDLYRLNDQGKDKVLFGVIKGKVSQNDTISLFNDILDISESARGDTGNFYINPNIWYIPDKNVDTLRTVKFLLGTLAKEAGDQSKIQVIENLSRNGLRSYVATVDSFFSHSFINGGVVWNGGNVEIFIPSGFEVPTPDEINKIRTVLQKMKAYGYEKIKQKILDFSNKVDNIIKNIFTDSSLLSDNKQNLILPDSTILALVAIQKQILNIDYIFNENTFNKIYNGGEFNISLHSGMYDEVSFLRRVFNFSKISEIFALFYDELYEEFKIKIKGNFRSEIKDIIELFLDNITKIERTDKEKQDLTNYIEQFPLFYLMRNYDYINPPINPINPNKYKFFKPKKSSNDTSEKVEYINDILKKVIASKLKNFCKSYEVDIKIINRFTKNYMFINEYKTIEEDKFEDFNYIEREQELKEQDTIDNKNKKRKIDDNENIFGFNPSPPPPKRGGKTIRHKKNTRKNKITRKKQNKIKK